MRGIFVVIPVASALALGLLSGCEEADTYRGVNLPPGIEASEDKQVVGVRKVYQVDDVVKYEITYSDGTRQGVRVKGIKPDKK